MTRIYVYPADYEGCGNYRLRWPAEAARSAGADVYVVNPHIGDPCQIAVKHHHGRVTRVAWPEDADVLVIQRPMSILIPQIVHAATSSGIAVVVDIDDDLAALSPRHAVWPTLQPGNPQQTPLMDWRAFKMSCEGATWVTASTPALLEKYGRPGRRSLLRNCLPAGWAPPPAPVRDGELALGWGGNIESHPDDLTVLGDAPRKLGLPWRIVGPDTGTGPRRLGLARDQVTYTGPIDTGEWAAALQQLDLAVAPLEDSPFNRAKSALKPLEYSAAGVPFVASRLPEYEWVVDGDEALLASSPGEWRAKLRALADDRQLLEARRWEGIARADRHVLEDHAHLWPEAWEAAAAARRSATLTLPVR